MYQSVDGFVLDLIQFAPAVAILLYISLRQEKRNAELMQALRDCYRDCEDRVDPDDAGGRRDR